MILYVVADDEYELALTDIVKLSFINWRVIHKASVNSFGASSISISAEEHSLNRYYSHAKSRNEIREIKKLFSLK